MGKEVSYPPKVKKKSAGILLCLRAVLSEAALPEASAHLRSREAWKVMPTPELERNLLCQ